MPSLDTRPFASNRFLHGVLAVYALVFIATAIAPRDWQTWGLENILVVLCVGVLAFT